MKINLRDYRNCRVLIGRKNGKIDRKEMGLSHWEDEVDNIIINIDKNYTSITSGYWLSLFGNSVRKLGKKKFKKIYKFNCNKTFKKSIEKFIKIANGEL